MSNIFRGSRLVAAGLIAACTTLGVTVATVTATSTSTAAQASTSARASTSVRASTTSTVSSPADRGATLAQTAMLEQQAKLAAHSNQQGAITGSVVGFDAQPVAGSCVTAVGASRSVTTAAAPDGTFRLAGLPSGSYALEYRDCAAAGRYLTTWSGGTTTQNTAARVEVAAGQVRHVPVMMLKPVNVEAAIAAGQASFRRDLAASGRSLSAAAAAKTGEITGKVTGKGKALRDICVLAQSVGNGPGYGATTTKNGSYTVRHVAAGRYHVIFAFCPTSTNWLPQVYKDDNNQSVLFNNGGTVVTVRAGHKVTGVNANLRLGGEISGTVTSQSGAKLRGICVSVIAASGSGGGFFGFGNQTAANGTYHLHALYPGKYTLQFSIGCGSGASNFAPATHRPVRVGLGQNLTVNQVLLPGASITGTVTLTSSSGTPLSGICVYAQNASGSVSDFTSTVSNGDYQVLGLTGGTFQVQFSPGCNNNGNYTTVTLTAHTTAGQQTSGVNAVLQTAAIIHGTVTGSGDKPLTGICVEVFSPNNGAGYSNFDRKGAYSIDQLSAGTYQVGFFGGCGNSGSYAPYWYNNQPSYSTASSITLTTGQSVTVNAPMQPGATITGKVTSGGKGLSGVCVFAGALANPGLDAVFDLSTNTRHGTYTLANLAPGQYLVNFGCGLGRYGQQWFPGASDPGAAELVSAPAGRTANINAALQPGGTIKGVVTGEAGHPLAGVCVFAVSPAGTAPALGESAQVVIIDGSSGGQAAITGSRGTYQVSGLAAGRYQVFFSPCNGSLRYAGQSYRGKGSTRAATDVTVRAGKTTSGIDGHLVLGGTISGRVTGTSGKPLPNMCVVAAQASGDVGVSYTGTAGTYTIPGLPSGRYTVEFSPCANQNRVTVIAHARVTAPHATTGINAVMPPGGSIAGTVTAGSASQAPDVSGVCVEIYSGNSAEPVESGLTGVDGNYQVTGLATGSYEVYFGDPHCFSAPDLAPQWYDGQLSRATAKKVDVTVGSTTSLVDAALQPDGQITGTVSAKSAGRISGVCVTAVPLPASASLPIVAVTGPTGYTLADLLPGRYKVKFSAGCGATGYATQWWKQESSQKTATVIKVGPGQDQPVSATLSKKR